MAKHDKQSCELDDIIDQAVEKYNASDIRYEMDLDTYIEKYVFEKEWK